VVDLGRREGVDLDLGIRGAQPAQQIFVPTERQVGIVPALHQDARAAHLEQLVDLAPDGVARQRVGLGMLFRRAIEGAELTVGDADVRVVDVAVDEVGDAPLRHVAEARPLRRSTQFQQVRLAVQARRLVGGQAPSRCDLIEQPLTPRDHHTFSFRRPSKTLPEGLRGRNGMGAARLPSCIRHLA
jgi:hypothetical protein